MSSQWLGPMSHRQILYAPHSFATVLKLQISFFKKIEREKKSQTAWMIHVTRNKMICGIQKQYTCLMLDGHVAMFVMLPFSTPFVG